MAAAAVTSSTLLHDPFSLHNTYHHTSGDDEEEATLLLDLLAIDQLIDTRTGISSPDTLLLNDLLSTDIEIERANNYHHTAMETAPEMNDEKLLLLDLLKNDFYIDGLKHQQYAVDHTNMTFHDPYVKREYTSIIDHSHGMYYHNNGGNSRRNEQQQLRDNVVMMNLLAMDESVDNSKRYSKLIVSDEYLHQQLLRDNVVMMNLLAMDESVDNSKRYSKLIVSDEYTIIGELYQVDNEISGVKRRALLVEDLQCLLDVDHLVDGVVTTTKKVDHNNNNGGHSGGKRSIFSVKEKYKAKVAMAKNY